MKRFFILDSDFGGRYKCVNDPIGWDSSKRQLVRNHKLGGVFPFMVQEFEFFKNDLLYIENVFEKGGTEAKLYLKEYIQVAGKDEFKIRFDGGGIFGTEYSKRYDKGGQAYVKLKFIKSGFQDKILNNMDTKINLSDTTSLNGLDLGEISTRIINNTGRVIIENNTYSHPESVEPIQVITSVGSGEQGFSIPFILDINESDSVQSVNDVTLNSTGSLFYKFGQSATIDITAEFCLDGGLVGISPIIYRRVELRVYTDVNDLNQFTVGVLKQFPSNIISENIDFSISDFYVAETQALALVFVARSSSNFIINLTLGGVNPDANPANLNPNLNNLANLSVKSTAHFDATKTNCYFRHEAVERIVESITDTKGTFKSDILSRREQNPGIIDGEFSNNVIMSGLDIRGIPTAPEISLTGIIKSLRAQYNLLAGIERIEGKDSLVIEELDHFYTGEVVLTLHNVIEPESPVSKDLTYNLVKVGYKKAELEIVNGLGDFNNKSEYKPFISSANKTLDLISDERADTFGIEKLRRLNVKFAGTKDSKDDKEVFTIVVVPPVPVRAFNTGELLFTSILTPDRSIDYTGIPDPDNAYNGLITPTRNLERNGDWVNGCLQSYPNETLKFINSDLETDLVTTNGGDVFEEQKSIQNNRLKSPLWLNRRYTGTCTISSAEFDALELKPHGLVKWSNTTREKTTKYQYMWVLEFNYDDHTEILEFNGLRANLDSPRLNIIDPDGLDHNPEETEEPTVITGGFESEFEFIFEG